MAEQSKTTLMIGGVADGRRIECDRDWLPLPILRDPSASYFIGDAQPIEFEKPRIDEYMRRQLYFGRLIKEVYLLRETTEEQTFQLLLDGYRQPREQQTGSNPDGSFTLDRDSAEVFIGILKCFDSGKVRPRQLVQMLAKLFDLMYQRGSLPFVSRRTIETLIKRLDHDKQDEWRKKFSAYIED